MTALDDLQQLRDLLQRHCLRFGRFTLSSGGTSAYYYNGKRVTLRPSGARLIGEALADLVLASGAEAVGGPALGAVPIATAVGAAALDRGRDLPVFIVRMDQKQHGARELVAEPYADDDREVVTEGRSVAIVEDAITTGGSVQKAIDAVEALDARVVLVAVLVEREQGGDALRRRGYDVISLFRTDADGTLSINENVIERLGAAAIGGNTKS